MDDRKTVQVHLRVVVLCDVEVSEPDEDGNAAIHDIRLADEGNVLQDIVLDSTELRGDEYDAVDAAAAEAFQSDG